MAAETDRPRSGFSLRRATVSDAAKLAALRAELFREIDPASSAKAPLDFEPTCALLFGNLLEADLARAWLAEDGAGGGVGAAVLLLFPRLPTPAQPAACEGYLLNVWTRADFRRRGVARELVEAAVAEARALGLARIRLHTTAAGAPVYAAAGFRTRSDEMELRL